MTACIFYYFFAQQPSVAQGLLLHEVSRSHTTTHHSRQDSSGRVISSSQRPLPDNTQHSQQTDIHAPGGIRTHNPSKRAAADLRLRPRGHWGRHFSLSIEGENRRRNVIRDACSARKITCVEPGLLLKQYVNRDGELTGTSPATVLQLSCVHRRQYSPIAIRVL